MARQVHFINAPYPESFRIYVVIALSVQNPLHGVAPTECTKTIMQPLGRAATQGKHAVGMVRDRLVKDRVLNLLDSRSKVNFTTELRALAESPTQPITTITKVARDSYELLHIYNLLRKVKLPVEMFADTNPAYGPGEVYTALATWPMDKEEGIGILDYLPLLDRDIITL